MAERAIWDTGCEWLASGRRDQILDAQGSSASRVHFVPSGHCKTVGLQASSSLAFRSCFFGSCFSEIYSCQYWPPTFLVCFLLFFKGFFFLAMIASKWIHRNTPVVSQRWTCRLNVLPAGKSRSHSGCVSSIKRIITLWPANNGNFLASIIRPEDSSSPPSSKLPPGVQLSHSSPVF